MTSRSTIWIVAALLWTVLIVLIAWECIHASRSAITNLAEVEAKSSFSEDIGYQKWVASNDGIYAPVSDKIKPNPFLAHLPERDILAVSGDQLTLLNHSYLNRKVHELADFEIEATGRLVSLNPIRLENGADVWEKGALVELKYSQDSDGSIEVVLDKPYYRKMFPLYLEAECLKCHTAKANKIGELYGGLSVTVPFAPFQSAIESTSTKIKLLLMVLWVLGVAFIAFAYQVVRNQFKIIEENLLEKESLGVRYRALFEHAAGGICVADLETGEIVDCNQEMTDLVQRTYHELVGQPQAILFPESGDDGSFGCFVKKVLRQMSGDNGEILEKRVITKDGVIKDVQIKAAPLVIDGRKFLQGIFYDITAQKKIQAQAIRSSQLATIGELSAGVAHEINNPIGGVINYAQILLNKKSCGDYEKEVLQRIVKEGTRIAKIVKRLLSISRKGNEERYVLDMNEIIADPLALINAHLIRDGIKVHVDVPKHLPAIKCNPQQLEQLVLNLVNNSRYALNEKFPGLDERKKIEISVGIFQFNDKKHLQLIFYDYGMGIPTEIIGKVKEPFCTSKPSGKGTGLGLSICNEIITNHGGGFEIESEHGEYTRVSVYLPFENDNKGDL